MYHPVADYVDYTVYCTHCVVFCCLTYVKLFAYFTLYIRILGSVEATVVYESKDATILFTRYTSKLTLILTRNSSEYANIEYACNQFDVRRC